jgi:hypothetical protein
MNSLERFKKFVVGKEFNFQTMIFRGKFTLVRVKERKLFYEIHTAYGSYDTEYDLTVNLNKCQWWTLSGHWFEPDKGFRRGKKTANAGLRVIIDEEIRGMMKLIGDDKGIGKITIKWLQED